MGRLRFRRVLIHLNETRVTRHCKCLLATKKLFTFINNEVCCLTDYAVRFDQSAHKMKSSEFVCEGSSDPSVCSELPHYKNYQTHRLCILHYPGSKNLKAFEEASQKKFDRGDFNFDGVWFPEELHLDFEEQEFANDISFSKCTFNGEVSFRKCVFQMEANFSKSDFISPVDFEGSSFVGAANFSEANFDHQVEFSAVEFRSSSNFGDSTFEAYVEFRAGFSNVTRFAGVTFKGEVSFEDSEFRGDAVFWGSTFDMNADFTETKFSRGVDFDFATFRDSVRFGTPAWGGSCFGPEASLSLDHSRVDHPDRFSFHTLTLKPAWFINVDSRNFIFTNVTWDPISIDENLLGVDSHYQLLAITYRQLALNAEENHRYSEASSFRYLSMDTKRVERASKRKWEREWRKKNGRRRKIERYSWRDLAISDLTWWYWLASGYGERIGRAALGLVCIWLLFAATFTIVGFVRWEPKTATQAEVTSATFDSYGAPLTFRRALTYSGAVITLQRPEPKPATAIARTAVLFQTILGPIQAALLALAIRRRFMR